jgi:hypothetical protein
MLIRLLSPRRIEEEYDIPESTQAKRRMRGDWCRFIKIGRRVYTDRADLESYLAARKRRSTSDTGVAI